MIIIVIQMRKYYTLVQSGRQEGDGAGNLENNVIIVRDGWVSVVHILLFSFFKNEDDSYLLFLS